MKAGTPNHIKAQRLKRRLKVPLYQVVGILEMLWQVASHSAWRGDIGRISDEDIAAALEWEGDASELVAALHQAGWLDPDPQCRYWIHDWHDHAPEYIKKKLRAAGLTPPCRDTDEIVSGQCPDISVLTMPCHALPIQSKKKDSSEVAEPPSKQLEPAFLTYPTNGPVKTWNLMAHQVGRWKEHFPGVDVEAECRKAVAWCEANPSQRKTSTGMPRFLVKWLTRQQNERSSRAPPGKQGAASRAPSLEDLPGYNPSG